MLILLTVSLETNRGMDSIVSASFGRAPYFGFVEMAEGSVPERVEIVPNPYANSDRAAGIQAAQFVVNRGAKVVISGAVGPNSYNVLAAAGVQMFSAPTAPLKEVLDMFRNGSLRPISGPGSAGGGMGMGRGAGMGGGRGGGRGMGGGMGRGRGGGQW